MPFSKETFPQSEISSLLIHNVDPLVNLACFKGYLNPVSVIPVTSFVTDKRENISSFDRFQFYTIQGLLR